MNLAGFEVGIDRPFFLISGPCVIESQALVEQVAGALKEITGGLGIPFIFKASFDKANRSSKDSFRGPGLDEGPYIHEGVWKKFAVPAMTEVHEVIPFYEVAAVVDVMQTPACFVRQTNFVLNDCTQGKHVIIKKGQFLSP